MRISSRLSIFPLRLTGTAVILAVLLAWGSLCAGSARAGGVIYDGLNVDIEKSYGSGTNETMLVLDWKSGATPSYAWLYYWSDPATTMDDAIKALAASEPDQLQYNAPGGFVLELNYIDGTEQHIGASFGIMSIWDSPGTGHGPEFHLNRGVAANLFDGGWAGIDAAGVENDYPGPPPFVPLVASVPEPGSLAMMAIGCAGLALVVWKRRRAMDATASSPTKRIQ